MYVSELVGESDLRVTMYGPRGILVRLEGSQDDIHTHLVHEVKEDSLTGVTRVEILVLDPTPSRDTPDCAGGCCYDVVTDQCQNPECCCHNDFPAEDTLGNELPSLWKEEQ